MSIRAGLSPYDCHKRVHAAPIIELTRHADDAVTVVLECDEHEDAMHTFPASHEFARRSLDASVDDFGYLVVYEDGFISWSPTDAFKRGYKLARTAAA